MYLAFIGPYNEVASYPWNPDGVVGVRRFLERVWRLQEKLVKKTEENVERALHIALKKVTDDIPLLKFNTAIAAMMTLLNEAEGLPAQSGKGMTKAQYLTLLRMIAPFAPHMAEELWRELGNKKSIHFEKWPKYDEKKTVQSTVMMVVQVNGKVRAQITAAADAAEQDIQPLAEKAAAKWLEGQVYKKVIFVPGRLINFVV
jgi:leucyl-tRNA synthetase